VTSGSTAPLLDGLLGITLIVHSHIGVRFLPLFLFFMLILPAGIQFDAVLVDYLHKRKFPTLGPLFTWTLRVTSLAVGVGVYQFNTNDIGACLLLHACARPTDQHFGARPIGLVELIRRVWTA
jgi:succinate dehydrogenase (ubiquinone) membrane anchor subunit